MAMSRLNPNAMAFPSKNGRLTNATHTMTCATSPAKTAPSARPLNEFDLAYSPSNPTKTDHTWTPAQLAPSPTAPHYGHNWATTFPPIKSSTNLTALTSKASPLSVHHKTPSHDDFTFLAAGNGHTDRAARSVPTHPMMRQPSSSYTATPSHTPNATYTRPSYNTQQYTHTPTYIPNRAAFEPFADDEALLKEAINAAHFPSLPAYTHSSSTERQCVRYSQRDGSVFSDDDEELGNSRNVFIPNPPPQATKEQLKKFGQNFGRVVSVKVESMGDVSNNDILGQFPLKSGHDARRYAFVMFDTHNAAVKFIEGLARDGVAAEFGRETAHLKHQALQDPHSSNCYFADIPPDFTEEDMRRLVHPARIASMRFLVDGNGNRRGTAMVRMDSRQQAEEVISRLDLKYKPEGCTKHIQVRIADSENQKAFKQNANRSRNHSNGNSSPMSRSSSFSSNGDAQPAMDVAAKVHLVQQSVLELQEEIRLQRSLSLRREMCSFDRNHGAMRRVIDVSNALDPASDHLGEFAPDAMTPRVFPISPNFQIGHSYPSVWGARKDGTTAPPPSRASSAGSPGHSSQYRGTGTYSQGRTLGRH